MAAPSKILTLNLGMQTIGLAEFGSAPGGGLVLNQFRLTELLADPNADSSRVGQVKLAVKEMAEGFKLRSGQVNYSIPAQSVFTRFVKLPPMEEEKIEQVITFEAQQNVPFPINEVVWDYQILGDAKDGKMEVALVAIKSDLLNELNGAVEDSGLTTAVVDIGPMALYNAFRYNYSDLNDCSLLIDIGARTTNLIFIESKKIFSRSISIGGTTITSAIARDFGESFGEAEQRKKSVGFVSLGGNYAEPSDPNVSRVSKVIRNTMTRLHAEISRSISFYRAQQQGSQPVRGFLCGGTSNLPYMSEFFHEKLNMPVEFFNPLRNVAVGPGVKIEEASKCAHTIGELVGLSLREVADCPMELTLQPQSVVQAQLMASKRPYIITAGICLLLALAGWATYLSYAANVQNTVLSNTIRPKVEQLQDLENRFKALNKEEDAAKATALPFLQAVEDRTYWSRIIDDINARLPEHFIWVTSFEPLENAGGKAGGGPGPRPGGQRAYSILRIRGLYLDNPQPNPAHVVDDFLTNLSQSPYFTVDKEKAVQKRSTPDAAHWAYTYELDLNLKKPMSVQ